MFFRYKKGGSELKVYASAQSAVCTEAQNQLPSAYTCLIPVRPGGMGHGQATPIAK